MIKPSIPLPLLAAALLALPLAGCERANAALPPREERTPETSAPSAKAAPAVTAVVALTAQAAAPRSILLSAVGDCTLAAEIGMIRTPGTLPREYEDHGSDPAWLFSGVRPVLSADDLTIANLETTLTNATIPAVPGRPRFRGKPEYVAMLPAGSVELVNIANNHSHDFGQHGYDETARVVRAAGVGLCGNEFVDTRTIRGVEIVSLGFTGGDPVILPDVVKRIKALKTASNLVIVSFHWGAEGVYDPNEVQFTLGHAAVDAGADLVIGTHPHVLQGIETYKGRHILYSLGNFVFGGHGNPSDMDAIIYQEAFAEKDGRMGPGEMKIIPVRISSVTTRNDYRPVILEGEERERVLAKMKKLSEALPGGR
jgi:poly-gamma-glutamate capsule biosynthesis protein CapA/YwtB (metallophosphatase superfamily)